MKSKFLKAIVVLLIIFGAVEILVRFRMGLVEVVVAREHIPQRKMITKEDLDYKKVSRHFLNENTVYKADDIIGKYLKLEHTLHKGDIIRMDMVEAIEDAQDAHLLLLEKGERIYTLKREIASIYGNAIDKGQYVDVASDEEGVILERVKVMDVKDRYGESLEKGKTPHTILLAVNRDSIEVLIEAEKKGKIILLPRGMYDAF